MTALATIIGRGLHSARPAAGTPGSIYYETDTSTLFRDNGASWDNIEAAGATGTAGGDLAGTYPNPTLDLTKAHTWTAKQEVSAFRITPGASAGAPTTGAHVIGDMYMDSGGVLYECTVAGTPGTWVSGGGGGSSTLAGDTDVSIASPATGDLLRYNGTAWANKALLATSEAVLGTDSAVVTASTFQDLVSSSLSAGTYLCIAHATAVDPTNAVDWAIRIWDGTTSYGGSEEVLLSTPFEQSTVCFGVVTLSGAGTIKLQGTSNATTTVFKAGPRVTSFGSQLTKLLTFKIG